jgi:uncharacterized protein (DUF433 family)
MKGGLSMLLPDFLTKDPDGYVHVTSHRIGLQDLVYFYNEGYSAEMLLEAFPTLSLALIHKTIAFYLEQRADVDAYLAACQEDVARQRAVARQGPDLVELRRRLEARLAAGA